VTLALATKAAFLVSAVMGAAPLWLAVVADTGATVAVTLNGLRLLRVTR
jgi:Cd2+/Zn2+-exporting ATPase